MFGIGDPLLLERRAAALAEAIAVPIEALDLALANWHSPERATLGFRRERATPRARSVPRRRLRRAEDGRVAGRSRDVEAALAAVRRGSV